MKPTITFKFKKILNDVIEVEFFHNTHYEATAFYRTTLEVAEIENNPDKLIAMIQDLLKSHETARSENSMMVRILCLDYLKSN